MSMPYAALMLNGVQTITSRGNGMLMEGVNEGELVGIHVSKKNLPKQFEKPDKALKQAGRWFSACPPSPFSALSPPLPHFFPPLLPASLSLPPSNPTPLCVHPLLHLQG